MIIHGTTLWYKYKIKFEEDIVKCDEKGPLEAHAVVFWAAVEHIVDYLVYCRRAAGASLQVYQLSAMDHQAAAAVSSDRVHNKNSSLGMWQNSGCDKKDSWHVWQLLQQLWFGSC